MTAADGTAAQVTLSGRELALMRRQAMALHGKAGAGLALAKRSGGKAGARPAMAVSRPAVGPDLAQAAAQRDAAAMAMPSASIVPAANVARLRRQALSQKGKSALPAKASSAQSTAQRVQPAAATKAAGCGCGCNGSGACAVKDAAQTAALRAAVAVVASAASTLSAADAASTRALARARRQAMATDGKAGLRRVAQATRLAAVLPEQHWQQAIEKGATARHVAMQRRLVRSLVGRDESPSESPRPSGRMRAKNVTAPTPEKVAQGHTLSGRPVTGTSLDSTPKVTGNEAGNCRSVTGTEYLGLEQFQTLCGTRPAPGPSKVGVSSTTREQKVTGTEVGRSAHVTGDEIGACRGITGTEYLAREHFESACATAPAPAAPVVRKVSVMPVVAPRAGDAPARVTGTEAGAARQLTGTRSMTSRDALATQGPKAPPKVARLQTGAGSTVTGTEVAGSPRVTGDDKGGCLPVTGTEYIGPRQLQVLCDDVTPVVPAAKVGLDQTWRGQTITGSHVGRSSRVTGDEPGGCAPISGTPYIGRGQYKAFCAAPEVASQEAIIRTEGVIPAAAVTGDRPGAGGNVMTGDERGACGAVSGTPYIGRDNAPLLCPPGSGRFVPRARPADEAPAVPAPSDFSIRPPARQAQERDTPSVTGTGFSSQRITGPVNKACGLITGTPEFRHREAPPPAAEQAEAQPTGARRLTGEGSQAGTRVSGDAWQNAGRVTGTEGTSSLARNPSQRGPSRAMGMNAQQFRDVERAAQPESRITGSSGNTVKGAAVTLSGGARG
jgi:hypothetical protein